MIIGTFVSGNCSLEIKSNGSRFAPLSNSQLPEWKRNLIAHNFDKKNPLGQPDFGHPTAGEYDWAGIIDGDDFEHTMLLTKETRERLELDDDYITMTGSEWLHFLKDQKWAISAFGTVFDQSRGLGIIAETLQSWYAERKELQAEKKKWEKEADRLREELGITITPEIEALLNDAE
jgi:hypothetical protein